MSESAAVTRVREQYLGALRGAFDTMLDRLDDALFDLAERAEGEDLRAGYFEVMRGLRTTRDALESRFLGTIESVWQGGDAPVAATVDQAENAALSLAVRYAEGECADEVALLRRRLMPQVSHPRGVQLALSPRVLFGAFEHVCAALQAGVPVRMVLLKFFERHVGAELRGIYQRLLDLLEGGTGTSLSVPAPTPVDLPAALAPAPVAPSGSLGIGGVVNRLVRGERAGPVEVLKVLATQHNDAGGGMRRTASLDLARYGDENASAVSGVDLAVDMMALLYDGSYGDAGISPAVKVQLARLQLPLLKVALRDPGFLSRRSHPARRFFSALLTLGRTRGLAIERHEEVRLNELVDQVAERCVDEPEIFDTAHATLTAMLPAAAGAEPSRSLAQVEVAEREAHRALDQRRAGRELPEAVQAFLAGHWQRYLVQVYIVSGPDSAAWRRALGTAEALVWAVTAADTPDNRTRLAEQRSRLVRQLRTGLDELAVPAAQQEAFYARLRELIDAALYVEPPAQEIELADLEFEPGEEPVMTITNPAGEQVPVDDEPDDLPEQDSAEDFLAAQNAATDLDAGEIEMMELDAMDLDDGPEAGAARSEPAGPGAASGGPAPSGLDPVAELLRRRGVDADTLVIEEIVLEAPGAGGGKSGR